MALTHQTTLRSIGIARELRTGKIALWLAREGTYIREARNPGVGVSRIVDAINRILNHDKKIKILIEPKPNESTDQAYVPTAGHAVGLFYRRSGPRRVGVLIESAHCLLTGLDPSDEMGHALFTRSCGASTLPTRMV